MNLLLDTHVLIWWLSDSPRLKPHARRAINEAENVWVSAASAWEIESKRRRGLLRAPDDLEQTMEERNLRSLPITVSHAIAACALANHHRDPFDRILVAQASAESLTFVTADQQLVAYGVQIMLA